MELSREECVGLMAQKQGENNAALRDVSSMPKREEFVKGMAQQGSVNGAALWDVPIKS
jgi:hypothetical protein